MNIEVVKLGLIDYEDALAIQRNPSFDVNTINL